MIQFLNTIQQIVQCDSVGPIQGTLRHLRWQVRRILHQFPCELPISASRLYVDGPSGVAALVNAMGQYDYNNMRFVQEVLRYKGGTFIDIGANIGSYTLVASEIPSARIISIEPHPKTFDLLTENVRRNGRNNVTCLNVALSSHEGWCSITNGSDLAINRLISDGQTEASIRVTSRTLRSICAEHAVLPEFIKIDVEGHECSVLEGFEHLFSSAKMICIEGGEREAVREWMRNSGYTGPWYVHYRHRLLNSVPASRPEDSVFLAQAFAAELSTIGFRASHGLG